MTTPALTATVVRPIRKGTAEDGTPEFIEVGTVLDVTSMANREQLFSGGFLVPGGDMPSSRATAPPAHATLTREDQLPPKPEPAPPTRPRTTKQRAQRGAAGPRSDAAAVRARGARGGRSSAA